jgi:signal transduction histidine kinase/ActR/RegA family two-component response regulator
MAARATSENDRIERERVEILFRNAPIGIIASATMGCVAAVALAFDDPSVVNAAIAWGVMLAGCMTFHLGVCRAFQRARDPAPRFWTRLFVVAALLEGLSWGIGVVLFASPEHYYRQLIMLVLSSGVVASTAFVLATQLAPFRAFFYPAVLPHLVIQLVYPYPLHLLALTMTVAFVISVTVATQRATAQINDVLRLRFENEALASDLGVQMRLAESASLAKSRFLAAASHDLRQPIHAVGMFLGALRGKALPRDARTLVDHIERSIGGLDDLFSTLLDVSRFEAGIVSADLHDIEIDPLLARICAEHGAEAAAKSLTLRRVPCSKTIRTDPVLLERVIRNLLSNAIKYTDRGGILVGCRRSGDRIRVIVGDTGRGIAAADADRIFHEFFQVESAARDNPGGLGLGLAIVSRIAPLIEASVSVSSTLGRGSAFSLSLPLSERGARASGGESSVNAAPNDASQIAVIDDDPSILSAMSALLGAWGYQVAAAETAGDLLAVLSERRVAPDLLISDYRLGHGLDGIAAVARFREVFGSALPAILITGDTAPDRLIEAKQSGLLLLHKPVQNAKLRAAIRNLLVGAKSYAPLSD